MKEEFSFQDGRWVPPESKHFARHCFEPGAVLEISKEWIFWCSEPFWSHDHSEPWRLDNLTKMQKETVAAVAMREWKREATKYSPPSVEFKTCHKQIHLWNTWGNT